MSAKTRRIPFTYEDYKSLAETADQRYELMDGELCPMPAPTTTHQHIAQNIEFLLIQHVRRTGCGRVLHAPLDVVLGEGARRDVVQPDIVFIATARGDIITNEEIAGAPDLVVEVLSPATQERDQGYKKKLYERSGVGEYWIVDPLRRVVRQFRRGDTRFESPVDHAMGARLMSDAVSDFELSVEEVFREP
jgi:Uma2 family endonuclease